MTKDSTKTYSTRELSGKRVFGGKSGESRIGKVARFIFHPSQKRCVGFIVKRPDLALMFHRPDMFVPLDAFSVTEEAVVITNDAKDATGPGAVKRLGLDWDLCVMWEGMPLMKESGEEFGHVGDVVFSAKTGKIISVIAERGATAKTLLGQLVIPADEVIGFRLGMGIELTEEWAEDGEEDAEPLRGAIIVSDAVGLKFTEGGIAEAAGQAAAQAQDKVRKGVAAAGEKAAGAAKKTGEAVGKGAFATGRQIGRARGMFSAFKDEYDKARGKSGAAGKGTAGKGAGGKDSSGKGTQDKGTQGKAK